jgi:hypothetical protein
MNNIGFGDRDFNVAVYIANKPAMQEYQALDNILPLVSGEIASINQACGNGWRKVFNVYAKVLFALDNSQFDFSKQTKTWQEYRDKYLLQGQDKTALLFSAPQLAASNNTLHIICGKGHVKALINSGQLITELAWLDEEFAIDRCNNLIVCPYFDYRQLSNIKIERLASLVKTL